MDDNVEDVVLRDGDLQNAETLLALLRKPVERSADVEIRRERARGLGGLLFGAIRNVDVHTTYRFTIGDTVLDLNASRISLLRCEIHEEVEDRNGLFWTWDSSPGY